jgi:hypothetical protein
MVQVQCPASPLFRSCPLSSRLPSSSLRVSRQPTCAVLCCAVCCKLTWSTKLTDCAVAGEFKNNTLDPPGPPFALRPPSFAVRFAIVPVV